MNRDKIVATIKTKSDRLEQLKQQRIDLQKKLDDIDRHPVNMQLNMNIQPIPIVTPIQSVTRPSPPVTIPICNFNNWLGEYKSSVMLGTTTDTFEDIIMEKSYVFLSDCISEYYTTKPIAGIQLDSKWNDGTNGTIVLTAKDNIKIIKCISQPFRGHNWHLKVYFA